MVKNFIEIVLSRTVSAINVFLRFMQKFKIGRQKSQENYFWERWADDSTDTLGIKNFIKIALSHTVSEINVFLRFTQKFKMATKNGGENDFWQKVADDLTYTLGA